MRNERRTSGSDGDHGKPTAVTPHGAHDLSYLVPQPRLAGVRFGAHLIVALVVTLGSLGACRTQPSPSTVSQDHVPQKRSVRRDTAELSRAGARPISPPFNVIPCQMDPTLVKDRAVCEDKVYRPTGANHERWWSCRVGRIWLAKQSVYGLAEWKLPNGTFCGAFPGRPYKSVLYVHRNEAKGVYHFVCKRNKQPISCFAVRFPHR